MSDALLFLKMGSSASQHLTTFKSHIQQRLTLLSQDKNRFQIFIIIIIIVIMFQKSCFITDDPHAVAVTNLVEHAEAFHSQSGVKKGNISFVVLVFANVTCVHGRKSQCGAMSVKSLITKRNVACEVRISFTSADSLPYGHNISVANYDCFPSYEAIKLSAISIAQFQRFSK